MIPPTTKSDIIRKNDEIQRLLPVRAVSLRCPTTYAVIQRVRRAIIFPTGHADCMPVFITVNFFIPDNGWNFSQWMHIGTADGGPTEYTAVRLSAAHDNGPATMMLVVHFPQDSLLAPRNASVQELEGQEGHRWVGNILAVALDDQGKHPRDFDYSSSDLRDAHGCVLK